MVVADQALTRSPWLSGEDFGIGDIPLDCIAYAWFSLPIERPDLPGLQSLYDRLTTRSAYRKAVMTSMS